MAPPRAIRSARSIGNGGGSTRRAKVTAVLGGLGGHGIAVWRNASRTSVALTLGLSRYSMNPAVDGLVVHAQVDLGKYGVLTWMVRLKS